MRGLDTRTSGPKSRALSRAQAFAFLVKLTTRRNKESGSRRRRTCGLSLSTFPLPSCMKSMEK